MSLFSRAAFSSDEPARLVLTATKLCRWYSPGRGLGYSFLIHGIALTVILLIPVAERSPREPQPWELADVDRGGGGRVVMYLPPLGGGGKGGGGGSKSSGGGGRPKSSDAEGDLRAPGGSKAPPADSVADAAPGSGSSGLVYPGPQLIRSNPPDPTNQVQTLLQPEVEDPPVVDPPLKLPNLVAIRETPPPRPEPAKPVDEAVPFYLPDVVVPEPTPSVRLEDLPTPRLIDSPTGSLRMSVNLPALPGPPEPPVGLADPFEPEEQQPIDPFAGRTLEPEPPDLTDLPDSTRALDLPSPSAANLDLVPEAPAAPTVPPDPRQLEARDASPSETGASAAHAPIEVPEVEFPAELPGRGTDTRTVLALSPRPARSDEPFQIPAGEARGVFTISPRANLDPSESASGAPSSTGEGNRSGDALGGNDAAGNPPSVVTITFGGGGSGAGSSGGAGAASGSGQGSGSGSGMGSGRGPGVGPGSGPGSGTGVGTGSGSGVGPGAGPGSGVGSGAGSGTGTGSGSGSGSGAGAGPGTGPFAGITIVGGEGGSPTSGGTGSGSGSGPSRGGIRILGGVDENDTAGNSDAVHKIPSLPSPTRYNKMSVVSTESSGGGLPFVGVFSNEQIRTVYLDMRQGESDQTPSWTIEYAVPREAVTQVNPNEESDDETQPGFVLPVPFFKKQPELPPDLVRRHLGKLVIAYAVINLDGTMEQIEIKRSPDPRLNQEIIEALSKWIFGPAVLDGNPVAVKALLGIPLWLPE